MKITKTRLKQIVQETLTEVRLDTKGTTAGKVQMAGNILTGAAFIVGAPFGGVGAPVAGGIAAAINSMANNFWTSRKMKSVEVTERHLVIAADKILSAAIDKGLDEQEIVKAISDDITARLENVPVDTVKMLRFEEYEVDKAPGSKGAKSAVKNALEELGLFGKDTAAHKVKRVTDFVTSPVKSIKNLGDPSKYLSESGKKITKSQLKQIVKEEFGGVLEEDDTADLFRSMGVKDPFTDREQKKDMKNILVYLETVDGTLTVDELIRKIKEELS